MQTGRNGRSVPFVAKAQPRRIVSFAAEPFSLSRSCLGRVEGTQPPVKSSPSRGLVAVVVALSIVVPSWGAAAGAAALPVPPGFEVSARQDVSPGVEHVTLTRRQPPLVMNVARISPSAPVDLQVVSAFDKVGPRENEESLEHPTAMCARVGCVVGVNGDFYHPDTEEPFGAVATAGRLLRSPAPGRGQGWQTRAGSFTVGMLPWSGSVTPAQGGGIAVNGVNVDPIPGGVVLYTPEYGPKTEARATELVVRLAGMPALGQAVPVEPMRMGDGYTPILAGQGILAGDGAGADALRDLWNRRAQAGPITLRLDADVVETVGIYPILVTGGRSVARAVAGDDLTTGRHARSLMGRTADGSLLLVTVDSRSAESQGVTAIEAADLLVGLGVLEGGNLDGGGGSTFVVRGTVANRPSDGSGSRASKQDGPVAPHEYLPGKFERTAVNMIAIVPRGGTVPGGSGPGSGGGQTGGGGSGGVVPGGGLFAPPSPGDLALFGTGPAGGAAGAGSLFAPSPLSSTPLASASALFKIFSLMKAKAAANLEANSGTPVEAQASTTTTAGSSEQPAGPAGVGESAAGAAGAAGDDSVPASSRLPFLIVSVLLLLSVTGVLGALRRGRSAVVRAA